MLGLMLPRISRRMPCPYTGIRLFKSTNVSCVQNASVNISLNKQYILGDENRRNCVARLQTMKPMRLRDEPHKKEAAVLVPLCEVQSELGFLYTLRSPELKQHSGQVSFPGGMRDPSDKNASDTALRETEEEVGIDRLSVDIWGRGNYIGTYKGNIVVTPILGYVGPVNLHQLKLDCKEVEQVFFISLTDLSNPDNCKQTQFRRGYVIPVFLGGVHKVWGLTAIITHIIMQALVPDYNHSLHYIAPIRT